MADRGLIGWEYQCYSFPVEHGKVREFAVAVKDDDPVLHDVAAARAAGYADLPAPPTFSAVTAHWAPPGGLDALGLDLRRVLAGEAEWEYLEDIVAGDVLTVRSRVADVVGKTGSRGAMTLVTTEHTFTDQHDRTVLRLRTTVIELGEH
ncbi:ribosomal protein S28E/S33 [Thermocatellispora tengchongensis]|uniref:Ribosomal protein S28E/S33 n=1 Tax=Thermocatellispora tengchongensis TaxID=1073253 RepID=A0A840PL03_9ACTN|nr:MaoC family dehydratase N-terminal domain-containing protein [Thermocatellispora tengchongensis]MBB5139772.1 ribosomal protein S28E/S33 [Thermocatellispora tengchongensis]